ncbi:MAG: 1-acyl-sn-glycerol-3-phosphate acyltransferase, partial [Cyclobacteriaceae bacterium]|nr:1-acyl-sn-glycerol-3-phosphate acyltransferase [Cyclobacteriaceae bacterium]
IENQIPIVPVTIPYNWILFPDDGKLLFSRSKNMIIFHDPIDTRGMTRDDLKMLKSKTVSVIRSELKKRNKLN